MATDVYRFKLTENAGGSQTIWIECNDAPGPFNDWNEGSPKSDCLIVGDGPLKTDTDQHCMSGGSGSQEVLVLKGASWSTKPGETGQAELFLMKNSSAYYTWVLVEKSSK